jgi:hypothetical protein
VRWIALVVLVGVALARDARASVAIDARLDELVDRATAVAVVRALEQRSVWEDGEIVTYSHVTVTRRLAGRIGGDAWIRTLGGSVGDIAQLVEGEATFAPGERSLLFLRTRSSGHATGSADGVLAVVERAQGQYALTGREGPGQRLGVAADVGALVAPSPPQAGDDARAAREVLTGRTLEEAARTIAATWNRRHSAGRPAAANTQL